MKQAIMTEPGKIVYRDVPVPPVGDGQIKVKMKKIGICGSDIHVNHGKHPYTGYPVVQGHEVSCEVAEAGGGVDGFKPGDKVTIQPQVVCGECYPCTHGMYNACETLKVMGFQTTGMASEFFVTDASKVLKLPDEMSYDHGAMVEPAAVAVHAIRRFGDVAGKSVLVLGGGPIGNLVGQFCKAMGAKTVLLSELSAYRLEVAQKCGIGTINPREKNLKEAMLEAFGTDGADVIFECVGIEQTINEAIIHARKGSDIVVVGVFGDLSTVNMGFIQDRELKLIGTAMYRVEDYIDAVRLIGEGKIELDALITDHVPFGEFARAYELIDKQKDKAMKVIIDMD
ncbi:MAG: alcohol dehydrogenase catalytic domain-containing protein [Oscillospiraceae bacterium]|nr:alcohol dehydrogenase catalytic domain-containing protein [Oscillospiraceae bacterium]